MLIWLNGAFGAGKTTTAAALAARLPGARLFDPEIVGFMLRHLLPEPGDFQDWPAWRILVAETAVQLRLHYGSALITPMTLLRRPYAVEIFAALAARGVPVRHVLLHVEESELIRRIEADEVEAGARQWRLDHLAEYRAALPWLREEARVIDTTLRTPAEVAAEVAALL